MAEQRPDPDTQMDEPAYDQREAGERPAEDSPATGPEGIDAGPDRGEDRQPRQ
jgi:hypothetical protein